MKRVLKTCMAGLLLALAPAMQAKTDHVTNEPDSVYLFSYAHADGAGGLKFAWSPDGKQWLSVADGFSYVSSDFGPWGSAKKMFKPHLMQSRADGSWHMVWEATATGKALAYVSSPDLQKWGPQSYFAPADLNKFLPKDVLPTTAREVTVKGAKQQGWTQKVPYTVVQQIIRYAEHKKYRAAQNAERMAQDPVRFAGLKPVEATVRVNPAEAKDISEHLIGIFFEDINYAADGGLYAELVQNRDFEYLPSDRGNDARWNSTHSWTVQGSGATLNIATDEPLHANNPHYAVLEVSTPGAALVNAGYDGIAVKKGEKYDFSLFARLLSPKGGKLKVSLQDKSGNVIATATVSATSKTWKQQKAVLTATADASEAVLSVAPQAAGTYALDMISLFPQNTFKGHKNGLRADLAQTLADLKPRFVRFPGGCVAHGNGIDNIYDWKGSIGPLEARKPLRNLWGYHQTRGLGYFEYFQFCEDMGAEPLPVLAAGVPCQNSGDRAHHTTDELTGMGQQGGIPMEEMDAYIQDVLDLIEYANGDARKTTWGKKRAEAGHPKPFNLKFIGIGNEDMITEVFEERFTMIYNAVREKYPDITVVGTVGPFYEGTDYDEGWKLATKLSVPMVDEHYYVEPGWLIHNQDYYDRYDRSKSKVYLGEYASHMNGRPSNVETALTIALYLTAVERNADVVTMTSFAPLLAKEGHTQWNPDLIYFNNTTVKPTVDYYVQQMYGQNAGTQYLPATVSLNNTNEAVQKRVGVSVVKDEATGDYIVKLANLLPVEVSANVALDGVSLVNPTATKTLLTGSPADKTAKSVTSDFEVSGPEFSYQLPKYSFTVIRIHQNISKKNK
ncbi:MAG: alpha-L-arabinofuranosidase C-terminal domain-containing protein [Bacteroides sp.]|nr:alpha-L-arabinofuranosidase C-terminal domain-containing protein [Bacteroides sp.]